MTAITEITRTPSTLDPPEHHQPEQHDHQGVAGVGEAEAGRRDPADDPGECLVPALVEYPTYDETKLSNITDATAGRRITWR